MVSNRGASETVDLPQEFSAAYELYLHHLISERRLAENSIAAYAADVTLFLSFLAAGKHLQLSDVNLALIHSFLEEQGRQ